MNIPHLLTDFITAIGVATALALRGKRKRSLSTSGAISAFAVGFIRLYAGKRGILLIVFYQLGSWASKYGAEKKEQLDAGAAGGDSERNHQQVLGCSLIGALLALTHTILCGEEKTVSFARYPLECVLTCAIVAHDSTCLADTLASELGILSRSPPRLITTLRKVPPGTNGAVSWGGLIWSAVGGALIGLSWWFVDSLISNVAPRSPESAAAYILFGTTCGFVGSFFDSLLGATLQSSYFDESEGLIYSDSFEAPDDAKHISGYEILTNVQVNVLSIAITCGFGGAVLSQVIFL